MYDLHKARRKVGRGGQAALCSGMAGDPTGFADRAVSARGFLGKNANYEADQGALHCRDRRHVRRNGRPCSERKR
jgi:hypothetical protein